MRSELGAATECLDRRLDPSLRRSGAPGQSSNRHRHTYETILYVLEGEGYSVVHDQKIEWKAGDAVYIPVWTWHNHVNTSTTGLARYLACENAPILQNLGGVALREELPEKGMKDPE